MSETTVPSDTQVSEDASLITDQHPASTRDDQRKDFSIIWHDLAYKVDPRPWYVKAKSRIFRTGESRGSPEDGHSTLTNDRNMTTGEKLILDHICGEARSGQITAILGPSGAGKSSLLHCLFQNRTVGTTGKILVDSWSKSKLKVCFIPQRDYLNEWLTVREDLIFVSKLKLARLTVLFYDESTDSDNQEQENVQGSYVKQIGGACNTSLIDHEANAIRVAELLGLGNCLDVPIKKISGGQRKRLSIARELMSKPDILILDEPTTGLDSLTCQKTIQVLRDVVLMSPNPMAVVVTIHQPQKSVFNLFDKTYFISSNGRVIYEDSPQNVVQTIETVASLKMPSPNYNPASYMIMIACDPEQSKALNLLSAHQQAKFSEKYDSAYMKRLVRSKTGFNWSRFRGSKSSRTSSESTKSSRSCEGSRSSRAQSPTSIDESIEIVGDEDRSQAIGVKQIESTTPVHSGSNRSGYYISHQLEDCLSSHKSNLAQSFRHVFILTHRSWLSIIRNPSFTRSRFAFHTFLPLAMLIVFGRDFGSSNNCPKLETEISIDQMMSSIDSGTIGDNVDETRMGIENISFFFILMYGFAINIISSTASLYPLTMHMFKKETINGLYSATPYLIGQLLAEIPLELFFPSISILLSYHIAGEIHSLMEWRMFAIAYVVFLVSYTSHSVGLLCGSIFVNNVNVAVLAGQAMMLPFVLMSGFVIRPPRMPDWMAKVSHISPFKHGMMGVMAARYGFNLCECDNEALSPDGPKIGGMTPQVRHVLEYMFPKTNDTSIVGESFGNDIEITELFDKLANQFVKAQTFGKDIRSCDEVQPFLMILYDVTDMDLFYAVGWLLLIITVLKMITFSIIKSFPYRLT